MHNFKYLLILYAIFIHVQLIQSDELLELDCLNATQCKQFQHAGITSVCIEEQCRCIKDNGESVKCQPSNFKMSNIIGGQCPCSQPNADCDIKQEVCYCKSNYMPSSDKRRCIKKMVALDGKCEEDSQCQKGDFNAICHHETKNCTCMDQFVNNENKCASVIGKSLSPGNASLFQNVTQCQVQYGANTTYSTETQQCICKAGHFATIDNSGCLKISKYLEECSENIQCIGTMGLGGKCVENVCKCSEKYFIEEKKTKAGTMETVCTAVVQRGQYCRFDKDCYQVQLNATEQTMDCSYGECKCKAAFHSYNNSDCINGSGSIHLNYIFALLLVFVYKFFSNLFIVKLN